MFQPDGRIILYNERYSELTGLPANSLDDHSIFDVIKSRAWPGDPGEFAAQIITNMREGKIEHPNRRDRAGPHAPSD